MTPHKPKFKGERRYVVSTILGFVVNENLILSPNPDKAQRFDKATAHQIGFAVGRRGVKARIIDIFGPDRLLLNEEIEDS